MKTSGSAPPGSPNSPMTAATAERFSSAQIANTEEPPPLTLQPKAPVSRTPFEVVIPGDRARARGLGNVVPVDGRPDVLDPPFDDRVDDGGAARHLLLHLCERELGGDQAARRGPLFSADPDDDRDGRHRKFIHLERPDAPDEHEPPQRARGRVVRMGRSPRRGFAQAGQLDDVLRFEPGPVDLVQPEYGPDRRGGRRPQAGAAGHPLDDLDVRAAVGPGPPEKVDGRKPGRIVFRPRRQVDVAPADPDDDIPPARGTDLQHVVGPVEGHGENIESGPDIGDRRRGPDEDLLDQSRSRSLRSRRRRSWFASVNGVKGGRRGPPSNPMRAKAALPAIGFVSSLRASNSS